MATGKRFYWIKLKDSFMTSDTVDFMMAQPEGANYVVLYQMLCLKTINTNGRLSRTIGEIIIPYDVDKIVRDCKWFSADTVRVALNLYKQFGLVYEDADGTLVLTDHDNLVGTETDYAERNRRIRAKAVKELPEPVHNVYSDVSDNVSSSVLQNVSIDIRDKENRDKDIKIIDKDIRYQITLNDNTTFGVTDSYIEELRNLYQAVDVETEIRKMIGWCNSNPAKRKTKRGIKSFINSWLARAQDKGGSPNAVGRRSGYGNLGTEI